MIAAKHSGLKRVLYSRKILEYGVKIDSRERLMIQEAVVGVRAQMEKSRTGTLHLFEEKGRCVNRSSISRMWVNFVMKEKILNCISFIKVII